MLCYELADARVVVWFPKCVRVLCLLETLRTDPSLAAASYSKLTANSFLQVGGKKRPVCEADNSIVSSLRIRGATSPFPIHLRTAHKDNFNLTYSLNVDIEWVMNIRRRNFCRNYTYFRVRRFVTHSVF